MKRFIIAALMLLVAAGASAKLTTKYPCTDGMVLQQNTQATVWGHASAGSAITVFTSWNGKSYKAKTASDGVWTVKVQTPSASYTNYSIKVSGDGGSLTIKDVLIGEVWIASGQSNMEMPIRGFFNCPVENSAEVFSAPAMHDRLRMFVARTNQSYEPLSDIPDDKTLGWLKADPGTVGEMSATAYFFALKLNSALDVPVGIVSMAYGGARVESWLPKSTLEAWGTEDLSRETIEATQHYTRPFLMYNAMEQPLKGYTAKGFIWYQGCSNVGKADEFVDRMSEMVRQWREDWGDSANTMPFYQVEIAPYQYKGGQYEQAPMLRQAQHDAAHAIPNSAIAVTNDLAYEYEVDNIHPCQKQPVGDRLAFLALHRDYGFEKLACYSPEAVEAFRIPGHDSEICVKLTNCPNGLDRWMDIKNLEVCGSEGIWKPVTYAYFEWAGYLRLRCEGVFDPCRVRYGWADFKPGNLHNAEGLPVSPFDISIK